MLYLHQGDNIEHLRDALLQCLPDFCAQSVFAPDIVLVQNAGTKRWLQQAIADHFSIAANIEFPLPSRFVWDLQQWLTESETPALAYDASHLRWQLFNLLADPDSIDQDLLSGYLNLDDAGLARFQLAQKLAELFDRYQVYRPDMIERWEQTTDSSSGNEAWQRRLWRRLRESQPGPQRSDQARELINTLNQTDLPRQRIPSRLFVFAISALSPLYLRVLEGLARHIDVRLFVLNPSRFYWGDLLSRKEQLRQGLDVQRENELLASMGRQGREFLDQIYELEPLPQEIDHFSEPDNSSLLGLLRHNVLNFSEDALEPELSAEDRSISVVSCYSATRELQVLHDYVLNRLQHNPEWQPHDIVVMCPDISRLAPYIQAVFGQQPETLKIPFTISDHAQISASPLLRTLLEWVELPTARFMASQVLAWLQVPALQRAYRLSAADVETITFWVNHTHIQWGLDKDQREHFGVAHALNTWSHGIERLLTAWISSSGDALPGKIPAAQINLSQADFFALGQLQRLLDDLHHWQNRFAGEHTPASWLQLLTQLSQNMLDVDEHEQWLLQIVLDEVSQWQQQAQPDTRISTAVVRELLEQALQAQTAQHSYLAGAINFCNLIPMRTLPFKCVCLIGMDDRSFPRSGIPLQLDLMQSHRRAGDPSMRDDDRYMFLQSVLAAREALFISYVGRSIHNDTVLEPSVVVSELLEYVNRQTGVSIQIEQTSLQPFAQRNYQRGSYSSLWHVKPAPEDAGAFKTEQSIENRIESLELAQFKRFFRNPAQFFYRETLGAELAEIQPSANDEECFDLDPLQIHQIRNQILNQILEQGNVDVDTWLHSGLLLPGYSGEQQLTSLMIDAENMAARLRSDDLYSGHQVYQHSLHLDEITLTGNTDSFSERGLLRHSFSKKEANNLLALWIDHVFFSTQVQPLQSRLIGRDEQHSFSPLTQKQAQRIMRDLLDVFYRGLRQPLPFVTTQSYALQQALAADKDFDQELTKIRRAWAGDYAPFEAHDAYFKRAFAAGVVFEEQFAPISASIIDPLLEHLQS